jgi:hypothetical protein
VNIWSPSTSLNVIPVPPRKSPLLVTAMLIGGVPSRNIFSNRPFRFAFAEITVWVNGAWKSMLGPGAP